MIYDRLLSAGTIFVCGSGVGFGIAREDPVTIIITAPMAVVATALLIASSRVDLRNEYTQGYLDGRITADQRMEKNI